MLHGVEELLQIIEVDGCCCHRHLRRRRLPSSSHHHILSTTAEQQHLIPFTLYCEHPLHYRCRLPTRPRCSLAIRSLSAHQSLASAAAGCTTTSISLHHNERPRFSQSSQALILLGLPFPEPLPRFSRAGPRLANPQPVNLTLQQRLQHLRHLLHHTAVASAQPTILPALTSQACANTCRLIYPNSLARLCGPES
jgi:hypothetical protein